MLNTFSVNYQLTLSIICLVGFFYFQKYMQPFKTKENNQIDLLALVAGIISIYSGLIFAIGKDIHKGFEQMTLVLIVVVNVYFLLNWVYFMMLALEWKNQKFEFLINILGLILLKGKVETITAEPTIKEINNKESQRENIRGNLEVFKRRIFPKRKNKRKTRIRVDPNKIIKTNKEMIEEERSFEDEI